MLGVQLECNSESFVVEDRRHASIYGVSSSSRHEPSN